MNLVKTTYQFIYWLLLDWKQRGTAAPGGPLAFKKETILWLESFEVLQCEIYQRDIRTNWVTCTCARRCGERAGLQQKDARTNLSHMTVLSQRTSLPSNLSQKIFFRPQMFISNSLSLKIPRTKWKRVIYWIHIELH